MHCATSLLALLVLAGAGAAGAGSTWSEPYTAQTTFAWAGAMQDCDRDVNVGGACVRVPVGASRVSVRVEDGLGLHVAGFVQLWPGEPGLVPVPGTPVSDIGNAWTCGESGVAVLPERAIPDEAMTLSVTLSEPVVAPFVEGSCGYAPFASYGVVRVAFS